MSFVFISHANEDKPRVRHFIDALRKAGLKVFLDNPDRAGYSSEDIASGDFVRLHYDRSWEAQLREAMSKCHCVLVCWSRLAEANAMRQPRRDIWRGEIDTALNTLKAVNVLIDDARPNVLYKNGGDHICFANTDRMGDGWQAAVAQLVQDVKRKMEHIAFGDAREGRRRTDLALPYYADRHSQENAFNAALREVEEDGGVHPIILHGPENELLDGFFKRLSELSGERTAQGARWREERAYWPQVARSAKEFQDAYRLELLSRLKCRGGHFEERIAEKLSGTEVTAIIHRLKAKDWRRDEGVRIQAWLDFWRSLPSDRGKLRVLPILIVPMRKASPGWRKEGARRCYPPGASGGPVDHARLSRILEDVAKKAKMDGVQLQDLPILGPIIRRDADEWLADWSDQLAPATETPIKEALTALFGRRRLFSANPLKHGVTHEDFVEALKDLCIRADQATA